MSSTRTIIGTWILGSLAAILASCEPAQSADSVSARGGGFGYVPTPAEVARACALPAGPHGHGRGGYEESLAEQLSREEYTARDSKGNHEGAALVLANMCPSYAQAKAEGCYAMLADYCAQHQLAPAATPAPPPSASTSSQGPPAAAAAPSSIEDLVRAAADTLSWPPSLASREIHCGIDAAHPADCVFKMTLSADDNGAAKTALLKACQALGIAAAKGSAVTGGAAAVFTPKQVYASLALPMATCKAMGQELAKGQGADRDAVDREVLDFGASADIRVGPLPAAH
jgi:hypothetical protein